MGILFPLYGQTFNKDSLSGYMDSVGIKYIPFSIAQSVHETANFRSRLFLEHNNLFGMKLSSYRTSVAIGKTKGGYAIYYSWKDSVLDFFLMQQGIFKAMKKFPQKYPTYYSYIYKNYAKDPNYKQKLQKYIK